MIQNIECIRSELQFHSLSQRELPYQGNVRLRKTETGDVVPPFRTLTSRRGNHECIRVQHFSPRRLRARDPDRLTWYEVWSGELPGYLGSSQVDQCVEGET